MKPVSIFILSSLIGVLFVISSGECVTYCVRPSVNIDCRNQDDCQKCETLQYYFENSEDINLHSNLTLFFMSGVHTVCDNNRDFVISVTILRMIGEDQNVMVTNVCSCHNNIMEQTCDLYLMNLRISMENLKVENYNLKTNVKYEPVQEDFVLKVANCSFQNSIFFSRNLKTVVVEDSTFLSDSVDLVAEKLVFKNCTFLKSNTYIHSTYQGIIEDCRVLYNSTYSIFRSNVKIQGKSEFSYSQAGPNILFSSSSQVTLSGRVSFTNNTALDGGAALFISDSILIIAEGANVIFSDNTALSNGGAIYMSASTFYISSTGPGANLTFANNTARDKGGAIYMDPGVTTVLFNEGYTDDRLVCFFESEEGNDIITTLQFANNVATNGGDIIYGATLYSCQANIIGGDTDRGRISSVSSDPLSACVCGSNGWPQCNTTENAALSKEVYPGQTFKLPVVVVGLEYGTTAGIVYSNYIHSENSSDIKLKSNAENGYVVSSIKECSNLTYSLFSSHAPQTVTIYISIVYLDAQMALQLENYIMYSGFPNSNITYHYGPVPISFNVTLLQCPPGFWLLNEQCDCYLHHILFDDCTIARGTGRFSWSSNKWVNIYEDGILYCEYCPFDYCNITKESVDLQGDSDMQCAFNRAGRLCGGCKQNYSLGIGSSHCIYCPNSNNLALITFFGASGILLVAFITVLNLTVTQGMINGLIFYANIVWTYQSIFFRNYQVTHPVLKFLMVFIAWLNLDFGIETCFFSGLTAFWKTWLQYLFPLYIWAIAGLIIVAERHSTKLTGKRSVPVLATLFLLSYMKLLRIVVTAFEFSYLTHTVQNTTAVLSVVWAVDGNLDYFGFPHILLFLAGLATLTILYLPYTLLLLFVQWLQMLPEGKLLKWIVRFKPVYDAYFATLKGKHRYWFGVMLVFRGILLMAFVSTFAIPQYVNLLLLLVTGVTLLFYLAVVQPYECVQPYKSMAVSVFEGTFFVNLTLLAGFVMVSSELNKPTLQIVAVGVSTGTAFLQFCGIVIYEMIKIMKIKMEQAGYNCNCLKTRVEYFDEFVGDVDRDPAELADITNGNEEQPLLSGVCDTY